MGQSLKRALLVLAALLIALPACSSETSSPEPTTAAMLTEVPQPHPVTCDLAEDLASLFDAIRNEVDAGGGLWRPGEERTVALGAIGAEVDRIGLEASVVGATDPWALHLEAATVSLLDTFGSTPQFTASNVEGALPSGRLEIVTSRCL